MKINRTFSVAPMMACTDRHYRYFARLLSRHTLLYTEMVTAAAIIHGDRDKLLDYSSEEHPIALQLGGSDPGQLAQSAEIAQHYHYDEINLNIGCPSDRVQSGKFGVCLMKEPQLVGQCFVAMQQATDIPVMVKTRIGVDDCDDYAFFKGFIETVAANGCQTFIIHARKAWLQGLSPRENREVPPLLYERVYRLKQDFKELEIIINGGIKTLIAAQKHLQHVDGVMVGREAYSNPMLLAQVDQALFTDSEASLSPFEVIEAYLPYVQQQLAAGVKLRQLIRHLIGLFPGYPGAKHWRRYLSEHAGDEQAGIAVVLEALKKIKPISELINGLDD